MVRNSFIRLNNVGIQISDGIVEGCLIADNIGNGIAGIDLLLRGNAFSDNGTALSVSQSTVAHNHF